MYARGRFGAGASCRRALKQPTGLFSRAPLSGVSPCGASHPARPLTRLGAGHPPLRPFARYSLRVVRSVVYRQGLRKALARPLPFAPSFSRFARLARFGSSARSSACGACFRGAPAPPLHFAFLAPRGSPLPAPFCRFRSTAGGSHGRPCRGLPLGWVRSAPPAVLKGLAACGRR